MSEKIDLSDIKKLDINYIELDPEYQVESDSNTIESDKDTDISDEEKDSIAIFSRKTHVQEIHYATVPIEYPKTSEYGVATVYNITGSKNLRDCWKNIQYSLGGGGQSSIKNCPFFDNISIKKEERNCILINYFLYFLISLEDIKRDNEEVKKISKAITRKGTRNEERKIALKERELQICVQEAAARKALAEAEAMEPINLEKKEVIRITLNNNIKYNLY
ncbi:uncharacterized protein OCT59_027916 [Rhizophagus irregularis]|uniref:uncharacterized protein n=1 Tax=Rhizophagus irregularis TaxID=588596 RepID=UPI00331F424F|nr:hypothetical protein OCT59_027916 [Rhizophagus irregularis]